MIEVLYGYFSLYLALKQTHYFDQTLKDDSFLVMLFPYFNYELLNDSIIFALLLHHMKLAILINQIIHILCV
jgi:hypothetical protein